MLQIAFPCIFSTYADAGVRQDLQVEILVDGKVVTKSRPIRMTRTAHHLKDACSSCDFTSRFAIDRVPILALSSSEGRSAGASSERRESMYVDESGTLTLLAPPQKKEHEFRQVSDFLSVVVCPQMNNEDNWFCVQIPNVERPTKGVVINWTVQKGDITYFYRICGAPVLNERLEQLSCRTFPDDLPPELTVLLQQRGYLSNSGLKVSLGPSDHESCRRGAFSLKEVSEPLRYTCLALYPEFTFLFSEGKRRGVSGLVEAAREADPILGALYREIFTGCGSAGRAGNLLHVPDPDLDEYGNHANQLYKLCLCYHVLCKLRGLGYELTLRDGVLIDSPKFRLSSAKELKELIDTTMWSKRFDEEAVKTLWFIATDKGEVSHLDWVQLLKNFIWIGDSELTYFQSLPPEVAHKFYRQLLSDGKYGRMFRGQQKVEEKREKTLSCNRGGFTWRGNDLAFLHNDLVLTGCGSAGGAGCGTTTRTEPLFSYDVFSGLMKYVGAPESERLMENKDLADVLTDFNSNLLATPEVKTPYEYPVSVYCSLLIAMRTTKKELTSLGKFPSGKKVFPPPTYPISGLISFEEGQKWICKSCTFHNSPGMSKCEICEDPAPEKSFYQTWTCSCGQKVSENFPVCFTCGGPKVPQAPGPQGPKPQTRVVPGDGKEVLASKSPTWKCSCGSTNVSRDTCGTCRKAAPVPPSWHCKKCTFITHGNSNACGMCGSGR